MMDKVSANGQKSTVLLWNRDNGVQRGVCRLEQREVKVLYCISARDVPGLHRLKDLQTSALDIGSGQGSWAFNIHPEI